MAISEWKRSLFNSAMAVSVILVLAILLRTFWVYHLFEFSDGMDMISVLVYPLALSTFLPFACIFPMLPYACSFLEEMNSGYSNYIVLRCGVGSYIRRKLFFTGLSGGIALLVPFGMLFVMVACVFRDVTIDNFPYMYIGTIWEPYLMVGGGRMMLLMRLMLIFMFGILWAEIPLMVSFIVSNRYVVFIVTFVLYQLTWLLLPPQVNTAYLFRSDFSTYEMPIVLPYIVLGLYIILAAVVNALLMRKRIRGD